MPGSLYRKDDALLYKVDGLLRSICNRNEPDSSLESFSITAKPLSGDGFLGSGLIFRIMGNDIDFMIQRSIMGHGQEKTSNNSGALSLLCLMGFLSFFFFYLNIKFIKY